MIRTAAWAVSTLLLLASPPALAQKPDRSPQPPALDPAKVQPLRPAPGQTVRAPRVRPRPNLSASLPPVLTPEERRVLIDHAATAAGLPVPAELPRPLVLSLAHLLDDATDDELILMTAAIVWPKTDAVTFADASQWPRLVLHPGGPGKTLLVDCALTGASKLDVSIVEVAPGTREVNHDERAPAKAAATQLIEAQNGHLYVLYQASPSATAATPAHLEIVDHAGDAWMLFRCEINRLD